MDYIFSGARVMIEKARKEALAEGVQQGVQLGVQQGVQQGVQLERNETAKKTASRLLTLLANNFGGAPKWVVDLLASAPVEQIDTWFDRALSAKKVEDVFGDLVPTA